ncbi:complex I NDUFA9 subunit family protein [Marinobacter sp.]|uniref:complex I NDUFA9 subunit family protein n=1 Tax=Marinobacter sp. TaxID=50741 RepID=UPI00384D8754
MEHPVVTVLGGTGFLGGAIVRELLEHGYHVRIACRHPDQAAVPESEHRRAELVACDIRDERSLAHAVGGAWAVVNAVALYDEKGDLTFDAIHVKGAERAARCARAADVERLVLISGIGASVESASKYVRARARGEQATQAVFRQATVLRPSVLCSRNAGFADALDMVTKLPIVPLFGRGDTLLQPVCPADVAAGVRRALEIEDAAGRVFELGGARQYSYRDCLRLMMKREGRHRPLMPLPFPLWHFLAGILGLLPNPPLNRDQVVLMEEDNVVGQNVGTFRELGVSPRSLEEILEA